MDFSLHRLQREAIVLSGSMLYIRRCDLPSWSYSLRSSRGESFRHQNLRLDEKVVHVSLQDVFSCLCLSKNSISSLATAFCSQVDLSTYVTKKIKLRTPIVSSPMDTVTEGDMAVTMAMVSVGHAPMSAINSYAPHIGSSPRVSLLCFLLECFQLGGMGFVHYNNTIEEQVRHVTKAKQHTPGMVVTPMVFLPSDPISKIDALKVSL